MHKYRLTPSAKSDLIEIWNYTVETWGEKQAEKYLQDIEDKLNQLAANPELEEDDLKFLLDIIPFLYRNTLFSILTRVITLISSVFYMEKWILIKI